MPVCMMAGDCDSSSRPLSCESSHFRQTTFIHPSSRPFEHEPKRCSQSTDTPLVNARTIDHHGKVSLSARAHGLLPLMFSAVFCQPVFFSGYIGADVREKAPHVIHSFWWDYATWTVPTSYTNDHREKRPSGTRVDNRNTRKHSAEEDFRLFLAVRLGMPLLHSTGGSEWCAGLRWGIDFSFIPEPE